LNSFTKRVMSLATIQKLSTSDFGYQHFIIAVILIFKHAMLQLSNSSKSALSQAEKNYEEANIDSKIHEYLKEFSPEDSVTQFSGFIMDTDIVPSQSSIVNK